MQSADQKQTVFQDLSKGARVLLEVAKRLFAEKGYDAVSINEIARQAGSSKGNVFHHFSSKEKLYLSVLKAACEETAGSLMDGELAGDAGERLWTFFSSQLSALLEHETSARLVLREIVEGRTEREQPLAEQVFAGFFNRLVKMVGDGQNEGLLRKDFNPALLAFLMLAANLFFFESHKITLHLEQGEFARTPADYSKEVFRLLLQGAEIPGVPVEGLKSGIFAS